MRILFRLLFLLLLLAPPRAAWADAPPTITIGSLTVTQCAHGYGAYCGSISRALDPSGHMPGRLRIGFEWYPRTDQADPAAGTIVAQEGGPGFSTTGSRAGYVRLFDALRAHRDILLMDKRGTGASGVLRCPSLNTKQFPTFADYNACGQLLGPAAWFYASRFAADDLAALITQLGVAKIDYYGDSYGTFFGQVFARRHPELIRTLVLDSAYPDGGHLSSPWFGTEYNTTPRALRTVCARSPTCTAAGDPFARLGTLVGRIRAKPLVGTAPNASGALKKVTLDPRTLFMMLDFAGDTPILWRDLDAATRAWLDHQDPLPLLRLTAEALESNNFSGASSEFSNALATAVICADYPQLFDIRQSAAARQAQYDARIALRSMHNPDEFAPFTIAEAVGARYQPLEIGVCLGWPAPPPGAGPDVPHGAGPALPTLVLNGELDTVTSVQEGKSVADMFPGSTYVVIANAIHEVAIGNGGYHVPPYGGDLARCAGPIVLNFIASGGNADTSCAAKVRPIRPPQAFVGHAANTTLPTALPGNTADAAHLHIASAATEAVGDVIARYYQEGSEHDLGLRGGSFTFHDTADGFIFKLTNVAWTDDTNVSGGINWNQLTGNIVANITVTGAATGHLHLAWNDRQTNAQAQITGTLDTQTIAATRLAP